MATVVQFGAGAIGRGLLGQLWTEAGYEVVFVDVNRELVDTLNRNKQYPLHLVTNDSREERTIAPVRAVLAEDKEAVLSELASCAFAATAVGPYLENLAHDFFIPFVSASGNAPRRIEPLHVLICENNFSGAKQLTQTFQTGLKEISEGQSEQRKIVRFVQAIVGRAVPNPTVRPEEPDGLTVLAEPYKDLLVEAGQWQGTFPDLPGVYEKENFQKYVQKKLYIHNAGHAVLAYHGYRNGLTYLYDCAENNELVHELRGVWSEVNQVISDEEALPLAELKRFEEELIQRFRNKALPDTVTRVGRDPARKLKADDRLVWPVLEYSKQFQKLPTFGVRAIAAALAFDAPDDEKATALQNEIKGKGAGKAFADVSGINQSAYPELVTAIEEAYNNLRKQ